MVDHGRSLRGTKNHFSKITDDQVLEIYRRVHRGENQYSLSDEFGVSQTTVSDIKRGHRWGWLTMRQSAVA